VIILTRLGGLEMAVNPDLIERAESTPDTVVTMVDGHKLVVAESLDEVVDRVRRWRASVAAEAFTLSHEAEADDAHRPDRTGADTGGAHALAPVLRMPAREV
jgi:flagellar protein FlbD